MRRRIGIAFCIALLLLPIGVAYAATPNPDSDPSLDDIYVFRHLLEPNDFLLIARYLIPYAVPPDASVAQAYYFRLMDTDNTTELLSNDAYPYNENGYNYGLISFYAGNTTAPTWGQNYTINLVGKPSEFATPPSWSFSVPTGAYSTFTTQAGNQADLAARILGIAAELGTAWSATLIDAGDTGQILSSAGELYFRQSIPGLQLMAPALFMVQITDPTYAPQNWATTQATTYRTRFTGTWIGDAIQGIADLFGMEYHFIASIPLVVVMVGVVIAGAVMGSVLSGLMSTVAIGIYGGLMGFTPMALIGIGTFAIAAFIGYQWFLKRA